MGVFLVEYLIDFFCMCMVLGKDNGLAQLLTVINLDIIRLKRNKSSHF